MEFRQVVHSVCRSAATAASRPSVASTRPAPSALVLLQRRHRFTTNSKKQSEVAAAVARQPQTSHAPPLSGLERVAQMRQNPSSIPPRPPTAPRSNFFLDSQSSKSPSWTQPAAKPKPSSSRSPTILTGSARSTSGSVDDMLLNLPAQIQADGVGAASSLGPWDENEFLKAYYGPEEAPLRLRPSTGRTINVRGNVDIARGLSLLNRTVTHNRIRREMQLQRFHERPGLKRKRLRSERWQVRFKQGFGAAVARTCELKAQGW